ncbi:MAG: prepilin peptidase [Pseudomonadota bacterium]
MIEVLFAASFVLLCAFAAIRDLNTLTIPNWLNGWIAFLFLPMCVVAMPGWDVFGMHMLVGLIAFAIAVLLFSMNVFGGGDAKMIPAVALWIGPSGMMSFVVFMAIAGGVLTILIVVLRGVLPQPATPGFAYETLTKGAGVPYGVAIAIGAILAASQSPILSPALSQMGLFG